MGVGGAYLAPDLVSLANLSPGRRVFESNEGSGNDNTLVQYMELLLPPLTDIRGPWNSMLPDLIEAPAGMKRYYAVRWVDDVAKGFGNEYRIALMVYLNAGTTVFGDPINSAPVPLP